MRVAFGAEDFGFSYRRSNVSPPAHLVDNGPSTKKCLASASRSLEGAQQDWGRDAAEMMQQVHGRGSGDEDPLPPAFASWQEVARAWAMGHMSIETAIGHLAEMEEAGKEVGSLWREALRLRIRSVISRRRCDDLREELRRAGVPTGTAASTVSE